MQTCKFCSKECKNDNSLRNHQRLCKNNPDRDESTLSTNRGFVKQRYCKFCGGLFSGGNHKKHEDACNLNPSNQKECPVCKKMFSGDAVTCSYSCANTYFRTGTDNGNWGGNNYRNIAKHNHKMKCVICGEDKILSIHHYDENHNNNDPKNLVPLCPTHHQYMHSRYKVLIEDKVKEYITGYGKV